MATTGWSGLYNREYTDLPSGIGSLPQNKIPIRNILRRVVNKPWFRANTALFNGLIGAATGSNVTATHKRIAAHVRVPGDAISGGGNRTIETITDINRNTAAADVTALKEMLYGVNRNPTFTARNAQINPR